MSELDDLEEIAGYVSTKPNRWIVTRQKRSKSLEEKQRATRIKNKKYRAKLKLRKMGAVNA